MSMKMSMKMSMEMSIHERKNKTTRKAGSQLFFDNFK
jgi:hypothetical protein